MAHHLPLKTLFGLSSLVLSLFFTQVTLGHEYSPIVEVDARVHQFYDATKQAFVIISDPGTYYVYNEDEEGYETRPLFFKTDSSFHHFSHEFLPISTSQDGTFFVHIGCGVVYHFLGDTVYRHDRSFYHQNQYGGVLILDDDEIYMYGGYGLFTSKNILVRYDREAREWFNVPYEGTPPAAVMSPLVSKQSNIMVFLGGISKTLETIHTDIYSYDFSSSQWRTLGGVSDVFYEKTSKPLKRLNSITTSKSSFIQNEQFIEIDIDSNSYQVYEFKNIGFVHNLSQHQKKPELYQVHVSLSGVKRYYIQVLPKNKIINALQESGPIWEPTSTPVMDKSLINLLTAFFLGILLTLLGGRIYTHRAQNKKTIAPVVFSKLPFDRDDFIKFRALILNAPDFTLEISTVNDLVEEHGLSIDAMKKRRERLIKEFSLEVSRYYELSPNEVFIQLRHERDRRIRLIKLSNALYQK